jgi:hypothetical protein
MKTYLSMLLLLGLVAACDSSGNSEDGDQHRVQLSFTGLEPLTNGFHYEGWAIIGGSAVTTGKFNVNAAGQLTTLAGATIANNTFEVDTDLHDASAIVLTIEPSGDTDTMPSDVHYLGGDLSNDQAVLTVAHSAALGISFAAATGKYILATPTDDPAGNETSGIWFVDLASGSPAAGLNLPTLPAGWRYEGWAVVGGQAVTTGTFTASNVADMAAPFSGIVAGPPFPGEDFLRNAPAGLSFPTSLAGGMAVISIEPFPDNDPGPFTLKPLVGSIGGAATDHVTYTIPNAASGFPTGTARVF